MQNIRMQQKAYKYDLNKLPWTISNVILYRILSLNNNTTLNSTTHPARSVISLQTKNEPEREWRENGSCRKKER